MEIDDIIDEDKLLDDVEYGDGEDEINNVKDPHDDPDPQNHDNNRDCKSTLTKCKRNMFE